MSERPCILIGAGGHALVLLDCLRVRGVTVLGCVDSDLALAGGTLAGVRILGQDNVVAGYEVGSVLLVNAIGSSRSLQRRRAVFESFKAQGHEFLTVVHPGATLGASVELSEGVQIMAGAILQSGTRVGANSIINTGAIVDHGCQVGSHVHLAPGCVISGDVSIGEETHVGTAATVIQGVRIGSRCLVAAGAVVVRDVPEGASAMGVPARQRLI